MFTVIGSTGTTGTELIKLLLERGVNVRAAARDVVKARATLGPRVEVVAFDLERPETFGAVLDGASALYVAIGGPACTPDLVRVETRLIDAARKAGVGHYVKVSGIGARPDGKSEIEKLHGTISEHLLQSGPPCTVLEPSFFMQNFLGLGRAIASGTLPMPTGDAKAALIDARDISAVAATVLGEARHHGQRYVLTGPALLSHADVATVMSGVFGRPVQFADVPPAAFESALATAGLPGWFAHRLTDVYVTLFAARRAERVTSEVERLTGRAPRALEQFLGDFRGAFD